MLPFHIQNMARHSKIDSQRRKSLSVNFRVCWAHQGLCWQISKYFGVDRTIGNHRSIRTSIDCAGISTYISANPEKSPPSKRRDLKQLRKTSMSLLKNLSRNERTSSLKSLFMGVLFIVMKLPIIIWNINSVSNYTQPVFIKKRMKEGEGEKKRERKRGKKGDCINFFSVLDQDKGTDNAMLIPVLGLLRE